MTMGPMLHGELAPTPGLTAAGLKNDPNGAKALPSHESGLSSLAEWFVDVRNCGRLHLLAFTTPSMGGKRYLAVAVWMEPDIRDISQELPKYTDSRGFKEGEMYTQKKDVRATTEILGGWINLEQSLADLGKSLGY
jgi:hypothetical protein